MRRLIPLLLLLVSGCHFALIPLPNGKVAIAGGLVDDPKAQRIETRPDSTVLVEGYAAPTNAEAAGKVAAGAVEGAGKIIKP